MCVSKCIPFLHLFSEFTVSVIRETALRGDGELGSCCGRSNGSCFTPRGKTNQFVPDKKTKSRSGAPVKQQNP